MGECTSPCSSADAACGRVDALARPLAAEGVAGPGQLALRLQMSQHRSAALHAVANFYLQSGGSVEQDIHARTKFDEAHALASFEAVADLRMKHDPPR